MENKTKLSYDEMEFIASSLRSLRYEEDTSITQDEIKYNEKINKVADKIELIKKDAIKQWKKKTRKQCVSFSFRP